MQEEHFLFYDHYIFKAFLHLKIALPIFFLLVTINKHTRYNLDLYIRHLINGEHHKTGHALQVDRRTEECNKTHCILLFLEHKSHYQNSVGIIKIFLGNLQLFRGFSVTFFFPAEKGITSESME